MHAHLDAHSFDFVIAALRALFGRAQIALDCRYLLLGDRFVLEYRSLRLRIAKRLTHLLYDRLMSDLLLLQRLDLLQ